MQIEFTFIHTLSFAVTVIGAFFLPSAVAQVSTQGPLADTTLSVESIIERDHVGVASSWGEIKQVANSDKELLFDTRLQESTNNTNQSQAVNRGQGTLTRAPYIGIGVGRSFLDPDSGDVSNSDLADDTQIGYQLTLGVDINRWLSAELHATELGDAELVDNSDISFRDYGLSALWYFNESRAAYNRAGLGIFGRAGLGYLSTSASNQADLDDTEGVHGILGAGLEYSMRSGLALRAEGLAFGRRVNYVQLGVLYRFGGFSSRIPSVPFRGSAAENLQIRSEELANVERIPSVSDADGDGVVDTSDSCPDTPLTVAIGENGCALFSGVIDGLTFVAGSSELSPGAREVLQGVVNSLMKSPNARARVVAHTDSLGDASANMLLSRKRAFEVAKFLVQSGIPKERLEARAFGEVRPIDTNSTAAGRQNNRRVEIDLIAE